MLRTKSRDGSFNLPSLDYGNAHSHVFSSWKRGPRETRTRRELCQEDVGSLGCNAETLMEFLTNTAARFWLISLYPFVELFRGGDVAD